MDHLGKVRFTLRSFEKRLYVLNTVLRESYRVKEFLERLEEDFEELKKYLEEHPEMDAIVREYVKDQELLPAVKDLKMKYTSLLDVLKDHRLKIDEMEMFFERYRNYRFYSLPDDALIAFVGKLFEDEGSVVLRLVLAKKPFTPEFAEKIGGKFVDSFSIELKGDQVPIAVDLFLKEYPNSGFSLESGKYSLIYKPEHGIVKVEFTSMGYISEVDGIVRTLGGTPLSM